VRRIGRSLLVVADSSVLITEPPEGARTRPVDVRETSTGEMRQVVLVAGTDDGPPLALATEATLAAVLEAASSPALPTGGATEATLAAVLARAPALNGDGGSPAHITNWPATQAVSAAALPLPAGAATQATLAAVDTKLGGTLEADVVDRAARLLGHVTVDALPAVAVSNFPSSQAVTGPLTDAQLRATAVPVSGTFWQATQPVSLAVNAPDVTDRAGRLLGHVTVDNPTDTSALATAARQDAQTAHLTTLAGVDYATGADIAGLVTRLDTIATNTADIALDADHLSITADSINLNTDGVESRLDTLNGKDFATQATLAALKARGDLLATEATLAAASAKLPAALVGGRLDVNLGASAVTLNVAGPLTDTQLRASAVPVSQSGAWTVTQAGTVTVDSELPAAAALADATANPTVPGVGAFSEIFNGTTWDRARGVAGAAFNSTMTSTGLSASGLYIANGATWSPAMGSFSDGVGGTNSLGVSPALWNGASWDRLRSYSAISGSASSTGALGAIPLYFTGAAWGAGWFAAADTLAGTALVGAGNMVFNGATWDRLRSASTATGGTVTTTGVLGTAGLLWSGSGFQPMTNALSTGDGNNGGWHAAVAAGIFNGASYDRLRSAAAVAGTTGTGLLGVGPMVKGTTNYNVLGAAVLATDNDLGVSAAQVHSTLYNGTGYDRQRNNTDGTALASAARTATTSSADLTNYNGDGVLVILRVSAITTAPSLVLTIEGKDPASGVYYALNANPTAVAATGTFVYELGEGASGAAAGGITQRTAGQLPRVFRVTVTHGNANSVTYSVGYTIITA
jgi:hypothetical protein